MLNRIATFRFPSAHKLFLGAVIGIIIFNFFN